MANMFKKTLVAAALSAAALNAQAATVAITGVNVSQEGTVGAASVTVPNVVVTLGAEYTVNDTVTFNISGAEFDAAASTPVLTAALGGGDTATIGMLSKTANSVTFRITAQTDGAADGVVYTAGTFTLTGMVMKTSTVTDATGDIEISYSAKTNNNQDLDNSGTLKDVAATVVAQFSSSVTKKLDAVVDVENSRQRFLAGNDTITTDALVVTVAEAAAAVNDATYASAKHIIKGDFSWMDADDNGAVSNAELTAAYAATASGDDTFVSTINAAMTEITATATDAGANAVDAHTFTFTVPGVGTGNPVLGAQSYKVTSTVTYDAPAPAAATKTTGTDVDAGAWTLNGSTVNVPYMVHQYGKFSSILNVQNSGTKEGAIAIDVWAEDGTSVASNLSAGTSKPGTIVSVAKAAIDALIAKGYDLNKTTKYSVRIVTNVPAKDISVNSAYADVSQATVTRSPVANDSAVQYKGAAL